MMIMMPRTRPHRRAGPSQKPSGNNSIDPSKLQDTSPSASRWPHSSCGPCPCLEPDTFFPKNSSRDGSCVASYGCFARPFVWEFILCGEFEETSSLLPPSLPPGSSYFHFLGVSSSLTDQPFFSFSHSIREGRETCARTFKAIVRDLRGGGRVKPSNMTVTHGEVVNVVGEKGGEERESEKEDEKHTSETPPHVELAK